jgi:CTP:molybdopterin cytidylyltransferase MocA
MGRVKALLEWDGRPLVARAAEAALGGGASPVIIVLGAEAERVRAGLPGLSLQSVVNPDWSTGMASSVRCGLKAILAAAPDLDALLVALCDQPALSADVVSRLSELQAATGRIAAARYQGRNGAPAVFGRAHFAALASLAGDAGARALLNGGTKSVTALDLPDLAVDLDSPEDLQAWPGRIG